MPDSSDKIGIAGLVMTGVSLATSMLSDSYPDFFIGGSAEHFERSSTFKLSDLKNLLKEVVTPLLEEQGKTLAKLTHLQDELVEQHKSFKDTFGAQIGVLHTTAQTLRTNIKLLQEAVADKDLDYLANYLMVALDRTSTSMDNLVHNLSGLFSGLNGPVNNSGGTNELGQANNDPSTSVNLQNAQHPPSTSTGNTHDASTANSLQLSRNNTLPGEDLELQNDAEQNFQNNDRAYTIRYTTRSNRTKGSSTLAGHLWKKFKRKFHGDGSN